MGNFIAKKPEPKPQPLHHITKGDITKWRPTPVEPVRYSTFPYHQATTRAPPPPPVSERPRPISYETCTKSYDIFKQCYFDDKKSKEDLYSFQSRIGDSSTRQYEDRLFEIRQRREREEARQISERTIIKPRPTLFSCLDQRDKIESYRQYDQKYFAPKPEKPVLTPEMHMVIEEASKSVPPNEAVAEIDGVQLLRKDIRTLLGLNWLNDEIINAYMQLLVARGQEAGRKRVYAFNTFFYPKLRDSGYGSVKRWTRRVDIFSYDFLIVPVHLGNHWCLALIDFTTRTISYYDSLGGTPMGCCDTLLDYLRCESNDKKKQGFDDENWQLLDRYHSMEGIPTQENCSDCGVFTCIFAEYLTRQTKLNFSQKDMPYFRKKMIYEIVTRRILE